MSRRYSFAKQNYRGRAHSMRIERTVTEMRFLFPVSAVRIELRRFSLQLGHGNATPSAINRATLEFQPVAAEPRATDLGPPANAFELFDHPRSPSSITHQSTPSRISADRRAGAGAAKHIAPDSPLCNSVCSTAVSLCPAVRHPSSLRIN